MKWVMDMSPAGFCLAPVSRGPCAVSTHPGQKGGALPGGGVQWGPGGHLCFWGMSTRSQSVSHPRGPGQLLSTVATATGAPPGPGPPLLPLPPAGSLSLVTARLAGVQASPHVGASVRPSTSGRTPPSAAVGSGVCEAGRRRPWASSSAWAVARGCGACAPGAAEGPTETRAARAD